MDPNVALRELLQAARSVIATSTDPVALKVAESVLNLHEWISKGGYMPESWQPPVSAISDVHRQGRSGL